MAKEVFRVNKKELQLDILGSFALQTKEKRIVHLRMQLTYRDMKIFYSCRERLVSLVNCYKHRIWNAKLDCSKEVSSHFYTRTLTNI